MLFKKLFQVLVVGGAVLGGASGCATGASSEQSGKSSSASGSPTAGSSASTAQDADAGVKSDPPKAGGVSGW
jgi:hypothetical protein